MAIAGGPRAGKSHLAESLRDRRIVRGTDELMGLGWSESSRVASLWFDSSEPVICEGVMVPRALRKFLARTGEQRPVDLVIWINEPVTDRSRGQHVMAAGCETVFRQIKPGLQARGVQILEF